MGVRVAISTALVASSLTMTTLGSAEAEEEATPAFALGSSLDWVFFKAPSAEEAVASTAPWAVEAALAVAVSAAAEPSARFTVPWVACPPVEEGNGLAPAADLAGDVPLVRLDPAPAP